MNFESEKELQSFIHSFIGGKREVTFSDGSRVDILTKKYAIEVKPKLTRSALLQALGQATIYRTNCPDKTHVVAGLTPKSKSDSYATAARVEKSGTQVWYVDQMPQFIEHWDNSCAISSKTQDHTFSQPADDSSEESIFDFPDWAIAAFVCIFGLMLFGGGFQSTTQPSADTTPVFSEPVMGATVIDSISSEANVKVKDCEGKFVKIQYGQRSGWVRDIEFDRPVCRSQGPQSKQ